MGKTALAPSPLAPARFPDIPKVAGARIATAHTGLRYQGRDDLLLIAFDGGASVAGLLTRSTMPGAPVEWCRKLLGGGKTRARALVVNAGNANVFTGQAGRQAVVATAKAAAKAVGAKADEIFLASTGIIGQPLDHAKITRLLPTLAQAARIETSWLVAAKAIGTTDTFPKGAFARTKIDGKTVTIAGIAKGSGMIAPDMATMLSFIVTDAAIAPRALQAALKEGADQSFHCLTVDGDTSTSDTVLVFATHAAGHAPISRATDPRLKAFKKALFAVMADLAQQVARDGEGAQKLITVQVSGAASDAAARRIALAIANSPLVKTAIAGEDANWGRIAMAVGKSGERANRDRLRISMGGQLIAEKGGLNPRYNEGKTAAHLKGREIDVAVDVGVGQGQAKVWTCDLTHGYIAINADYRS